jgi:MFS family permease
VLTSIHSPLSEHYGRKVPLLIGYICFALLQLPVAEAHSLAIIFIFRFLQGVFGSAPSAILSGTLADIWTPQQRGFAMPAVGSFLMIGPVLGPIVSTITVSCQALLSTTRLDRKLFIVRSDGGGEYTTALPANF